MGFLQPREVMKHIKLLTEKGTVGTSSPALRLSFLRPAWVKPMSTLALINRLWQPPLANTNEALAANAG